MITKVGLTARGSVRDVLHLAGLGREEIGCVARRTVTAVSHLVWIYIRVAGDIPSVDWQMPGPPLSARCAQGPSHQF